MNMRVMIHEPTTIMIVEDTADDEALELRAIRSLAQPLHVRVARDGRRALEMLGIAPGQPEGAVPDERLPKVILLDYKLPYMSGPKVLARIRANSRTAGIPVVFFTSSDEEADIALAKAAGASSFVRKPIDFDEFVSTVRDVVAYWTGRDQAPRRPFCHFDAPNDAESRRAP